MRGFSQESLKKLRNFYEQWSFIINRSPSATDLQTPDNQSLIDINSLSVAICQSLADEFNAEYLRIIDSEIKKPFENPTIGIILCKSADKSYVEFLIQGYNNPMGVATYKTAEDVRKVLPSEEELRRIMDGK